MGLGTWIPDQGCLPTTAGLRWRKSLHARRGEVVECGRLTRGRRAQLEQYVLEVGQAHGAWIIGEPPAVDEHGNGPVISEGGALSERLAPDLEELAQCERFLFRRDDMPAPRRVMGVNPGEARAGSDEPAGI